MRRLFSSFILFSFFYCHLRRLLAFVIEMGVSWRFDEEKKLEDGKKKS
jgi:hypothetical protein